MKTTWYYTIIYKNDADLMNIQSNFKASIYYIYTNTIDNHTLLLKEILQHIIYLSSIITSVKCSLCIKRLQSLPPQVKILYRVLYQLFRMLYLNAITIP